MQVINKLSSNVNPPSSNSKKVQGVLFRYHNGTNAQDYLYILYANKSICKV